MNQITLKREIILDLLPRQATRRNAAVILDLIEEKFSEGYAELILSYGANEDHYTEQGLNKQHVERTIQKLAALRILVLTEKHAKGVRYQKHMVHADFVIFAKREAVFGRTRDLYYFVLENYGFGEWLNLKARVYANGHKRATFKRLLEEATASGMIH